MTKYKVVDTTSPHFLNIEFDFDDTEIQSGSQVMILGMTVTVTQVGGGIIAGSNQDEVMVIQRVKND